MNTDPYPSEWLKPWSWHGIPVGIIAAPAKTIETPDNNNTKSSPAVLIHGFGACKEHWRHNIETLREERSVYAIDLIGFGSSGKPISHLEGEEEATNGVRYGIDLWSKQVADFVTTELGTPVHLVGNSIGGVVALAAAQKLEKAGIPARGVILVNCAQRALDDKRLSEQPRLLRWGRPLLKNLTRQRWLTTRLFKTFANPRAIHKVLLEAYPSGANVDDELVQLLLRPALAPGAEEAFRGFINLFNDWTAPELLEVLQTPVTMIWGERDPWEPIQEARRWRRFSCVVALHELKGLGHCPHDEAPEQVNPLLLAALG